MMVAQLQTVPAEQIKNFALIVAAILAGAYYVKAIFFSRKQQAEVNMAFEAASQKAFEKHVEDTKENFQSLRVEAAGRTASLYKALEEVRREVNNKIDIMPDRIITQLRNTKGLLR